MYASAGVNSMLTIEVMGRSEQLVTWHKDALIAKHDEVLKIDAAERESAENWRCWVREEGE